MSKKFLFIYRSPSSDQMPTSAAEMQTVLEQWGKWKQKFPAIVDMGDGLLRTGKRLTASAVSDGPAVESKEIVSGYSIVSGGTYDDVVTIAKECPILRVPGNTVEVRELAGY